MFRGNTSFQLAVVLLVLFAAFVAQVTHRPYMSTGEKERVRDYLEVMVKKSRERPKLRYYVMQMKRKHFKKKRNNLTKIQWNEAVEKETNKRGSLIPTEVKTSIFRFSKDNEDNKDYYFDYNTVESVLLGCSILVCLGGLMFESNIFGNLDDEDPSIGENLKAQNLFLTYMLIIVVFGSLIYYFFVFAAESKFVFLLFVLSILYSII